MGQIPLAMPNLTSALSANPFFHTPADRIAWARERFFESGLRPSGLISEPVFQSWQRCLAAGLKPHQRPSFEPVTKWRVSAALARSQSLLAAAAPELDQLDSLLAGTPCRLILADNNGIVLRATAPPAGGSGVLDIGSRPGVDLAEANLGSTAPAVTVRSGGACSVSAGEHFFGCLQHVYCAAAPVRDRDGSLAAVLDLSIEGKPFAFDAFAVVRLYAAAIENRLVAASAHDHLLLRFQLNASLLGTPMQGLAIVDGRGEVGWVNTAGSALLEQPRSPSAARSAEALFGLGLSGLLRLVGSAAPQPHRLPSGLGVWLQVAEPGRGGAAAPLPQMAAEPAARPASLDDVHRRHIEDTLAESHGNISAAARRLGVSRGLLYRRLRSWQAGDKERAEG